MYGFSATFGALSEPVGLGLGSATQLASSLLNVAHLVAKQTLVWETDGEGSRSRRQGVASATSRSQSAIRVAVVSRSRSRSSSTSVSGTDRCSARTGCSSPSRRVCAAGTMIVSRGSAKARTSSPRICWGSSPCGHLASAPWRAGRAPTRRCPARLLCPCQCQSGSAPA